MKKYVIRVNGKSYEVEVEEVKAGASPAPGTNVSSSPVQAPIPPSPAPQPKAAPLRAEPDGKGSRIAAPMTGAVLKLNVNPGDSVMKGQVLLILEAMKMENEIFAPFDGKVTFIHVSVGSSVNAGEPLIDFDLI